MPTPAGSIRAAVFFAIWLYILAPAGRADLQLRPVVGPEIPSCATFGPAPGNQEGVEFASSPDGYLAVWQDSRNSQDFDIFGCRISPSGQPIDTLGIAISAVSGEQTDPAAAWNGREYLVVWADRRGSSAHIYAARVERDGEVIDKQGILISGTTGAQSYPRVASDAGGWLVVWQDSKGSSPDIYGRKVNGDGSLGNIYGISTSANNEESPDVAWNGSDFVVVWRDYRNIAATDTDIYGCRVGRNGVRKGSDILISCTSSGSSGAPGKQSDPRVCAFGSTCMVVWSDCRNNPEESDVYGARVISTGVVSDKGGIRISNAPDAQELPSIGYNGSSLLAVWRDRSDRLVKAARITTGGIVSDPNGITISAGMAGAAGCAVAGSNAKFIVGWNNLDVTNAGVFATLVSNGGAVQNPSGTTVSVALDDQADYAVTDNGAEYVIVWSQLANGSYDIMAAKLSHSGVFLTPTPINITASYAGDQTQPSIAWNGSKYFVVWCGNENYSSSEWDIRGWMLDANLNRIGASPTTICAATADQARPCVASNRNGFLAVWEDSRSAVSPNYYTDIYGAIVTSNGQVSTTSPAIDIENGDQRKPRVTSDGTNYFVVWEDYRLGYPQIYGTRVTSSAQTQDARGIAFPATSYNQTTPDVCYGSGNYFVTWSDWYEISACRVTPAGVVRDLAGIEIDTGTKTKSNPTACWDGSRYRVVWEDYRSQYTGNSDIYYTTVSSSGVVSPDPKTALVSDMTAQLRPRIYAWDTLGTLIYSRYYNYANRVCAVTLEDQGLREVDGIADAKQLPAGSLVSLTGKVVTAVFPDCFYIEETDRSSGIKVVSPDSVTANTVVDVIGMLSICDGERQVNVCNLYALGAALDPPRPLGIRGDLLGGAALNSYTPGVTGGLGVNNIGILATTWGKVTSSVTGYFYIQVTPGITVKVKSGTLTRPQVGAYVTVTGISTSEVLSGTIGRAIRPREQSDIVVLR